ncbi:MAG: murein biosynthesis integral membrane protein MurJ [Oscillospiraceae bacterium]|nr:murein biosynthesis integral membrane protein MurJ [Oscillospiraceae bacterium]
MDNSSRANRIFRGTVIIVFVGILAKFASFISEAVMAAYLGTTYQSDAYYMISSIHGVVYPMMSIGIWRVFLPLYKSHVAKKEIATANALTDKALTFFTAISLIVVFLLIIFAPQVVSVVAPGFKGVTRELCIKLVRISAPMYVFIIASAVYAAVLRCHDKFLGSQIREVASHIPTIIAAIFFYRTFGIEAMAVALVVAGILRLLIELPFVDWGYRYKPDFSFRTEEFNVMLKRLPSALLSAGVAELNTLIDKAMASTLPAGAISALNYGNKLRNVFSGLLSSAISTALFPQMVELIALDKKQELSRLMLKIINIFCVLMIPVSLACVLFRTELVSVVFERGAFGHESTALTASIFALYTLSLFSAACNSVVSNIFYGFGDTRTPMQISVVNLGLNVALNFLMINRLGAAGLALATSISSVVTLLIRIVASEKYVELEIRSMASTAGKVVLASIVACVIPRIIFWVYPINKYFVLFISAIMGIAIYYLCVKLLKVREIDDLISLFGKRLKKAK